MRAAHSKRLVHSKIGSPKWSARLRLVSDVSRDLLVSRKPNSWTRAHVLNQLLKHRHSRAMPDHVRMHCENEHRAFFISLVELRAPDGEHFVGSCVWPKRRSSIHPKVRKVVHDPLNRQFDYAGGRS